MLCHHRVVPGGLPLHLTSATLLRVSAEGAATALVLTVHARTGRAAEAGFLQTAVTLPYVLSGPVIGHLLDRAARPRVPAVALAAGYALATALLLLIAGRSPLVLALLVAVVVGCTEPIVVALTSLLPRFVAEDRLPRAYGLEAASYSGAAIAGPGLAAAIAAYAGGTHAGLAIVAAAAVGAVVLVFLSQPGPQGVAARSTRLGLRDVVTGGLHVLGANRVLRALTAATTIGWVGFGGMAVTAVLFAQHIGADAAAGGRLLVAFAAGSLIGSLAVSRRLRARHAERVALGGLTAFGGAVALVCLAPSQPWALLCFLLVGLAEGPLFTATLMLRQREAPPERLGQVNTTGGSLKIGGSAVGAALTGAFADEVGAIGLLLAIAACQLIGALVGLLLLWTPRERG